MLRTAWENKRHPLYAWRILSKGVCDGCALGVAGFSDWTIDGVHLCSTRLNLLKVNTMRPDIGKDPRIEGAHRVDLEQVQARCAQVDAVDRPVREASDTERAAVAHAFREDPPRVQRMPLVLPGCAQHLDVVVRLRLADAIRNRADPQARLDRKSVV